MSKRPKRSDDLRPGEIENAFTWYNAHRLYVLGMSAYRLGDEPPAYPPSGSDCAHPKLWKPAHWRWFLKVCTTYPGAYEG